MRRLFQPVNKMRGFYRRTEAGSKLPRPEATRRRVFSGCLDAPQQKSVSSRRVVQETNESTFTESPSVWPNLVLVDIPPGDGDKL